jgi:hypothetical protein
VNHHHRHGLGAQLKLPEEREDVLAPRVARSQSLELQLGHLSATKRGAHRLLHLLILHTESSERVDRLVEIKQILASIASLIHDDLRQFNACHSSSMPAAKQESEAAEPKARRRGDPVAASP